MNKIKAELQAENDLLREDVRLAFRALSDIASEYEDDPAERALDALCELRERVGDDAETIRLRRQSAEATRLRNGMLRLAVTSMDRRMRGRELEEQAA